MLEHKRNDNQRTAKSALPRGDHLAAELAFGNAPQSGSIPGAAPPAPALR